MLKLFADNMIKLMGWLIAGMFLVIITILLSRGVKLYVNPPAKQYITLPESTHIIEIPRKNGKPPFRLNMKSPEKKLLIERGDDK